MVSSAFPSAWYSNIQYLFSVSSIFALFCLFVFVFVFRRHQGSKPGCTSSSDAREESSNNESDLPAYSGSEYDVFLSFRGPDVREHFIDYLYEDLIEARISTFRDDDELRVGQEIGPSLFRAIGRSKIFVPIFSKGYASSKWCLQELAYMIDSMREKQVILPVFYQVPPNDVRHQSGLYKQAFHEHKKKGISEDMIRKWKEALNDVGKLKGLVLENDAEGHKGKLKNLVIERVLNLLKEPSVVVTESFVGVDDQAEKIMELLDTKTNHVQIVGLYGMGGIGKTTIAKFIYNQLFHEFECCSFLSDIRESSHAHGLAYLQKQLISDMLKRKFQDFYSVDDGSKIIREEFRHKKVLIVLDDVSERNHIDKLVGSIDWFGTGSRVIVTARDKDLLNVPQVHNTHEVEGLNLGKSLQLFCNHAFSTDPPPKYREIADAIVSTTGGLPLALEVIGSFLYNKEIDAWNSILEKLKESPHDIVQSSLMISYDKLNEEQRQIFLDIACLYVGYDKNLVSYMWEACNLFPQFNILILINKCFVKIDNNSKVRMHDQLRDFGREIVRRENFVNPGKRSRVWEYKDAIDVLKRDKGTDKVEALSCRINRPDAAERIKSIKSLSLSDREFKNLVNLKFFQMHSADFNGDFKDQFSELRWLDLRQCIFRASLSNFFPASLVILELHDTNVTDNWEGWSILQEAWNLKVLHVDNCLNITELAESFGSLGALQSLNIEGCDSLSKLPSSFGSLGALQSLNIVKCYSLSKLPSSFGSLGALQSLNIEGCYSLSKLPSSFGSLGALQSLNIEGCKSLSKLPSSFGSLGALQSLNIEGCDSLSKLPSSFGSLGALQSLNIEWCKSLSKLPSSFGSLGALQSLNIGGCGSLSKLPSSFGSLGALQSLNIVWCKSLSKLPSSFGSLGALQSLNIE